MDGGVAESIESAAPEGRVARRRTRVRQRILDVAERLMLERGVDRVTIDDIAEAANIARRSFYHYFDSKSAVLVPIARARTRSLNERIDRLVGKIDDPAQVMATAMRHGLRELSGDPLCGWFVLHSGLPQEMVFEGLGQSAMRDALAGVKAGRFHVGNLDVVRLMVSGAFIAVMTGRLEKRLDDRDLDDAVEHVLRILGVASDEARKIAHGRLRPLPALREGERDRG